MGKSHCDGSEKINPYKASEEGAHHQHSYIRSDLHHNAVFFEDKHGIVRTVFPYMARGLWYFVLVKSYPLCYQPLLCALKQQAYLFCQHYKNNLDKPFPGELVDLWQLSLLQLQP